MTPEERREMIRQQVNSKIYWGTRDIEVYQWLGSKHGITGTVADEMLGDAHRAKRKAVRKRAFIMLICSGIGLAASVFTVWLMSFGRISATSTGVRFGYAFYIVCCAVAVCAGVFLKNLYYLLTGNDERSVE
jgi:hypothetical protein